MLGRVRPLSSDSSLSLDTLERPSPKIIKHDSLSIYEATLMKLKLASQRDISSIKEEPMTIEIDAACASASESSQNELSLQSVEANEMETKKRTDCSSMTKSCSYSLGSSPSCSHSLGSSPSEEAMTIDTDDASLGCGDCQPMITLVKQKRNKNLSIAAMFSKYKSGQRAQGSACEEAMWDNGGSYSDGPMNGH